MDMPPSEIVWDIGVSYRDLLEISGPYLKRLLSFLENCSQEQFSSLYESNPDFQRIVNIIKETSCY